MSLARDEAEAFLIREARYADENRCDEWLDLWTDDAIYWVPANLDDYDPRKHLSLIYDRRDRLQDRVDRLKSGAAWSQEPRSRMRRLISNIELEGVAANGDFVVRSNFVLGEMRKGLQTEHFAAQIHHLRRESGALKMSMKKVLLINNNDPIHNLTFLI